MGERAGNAVIPLAALLSTLPVALAERLPFEAGAGDDTRNGAATGRANGSTPEPEERG